MDLETCLIDSLVFNQDRARGDFLENAREGNGTLCSILAAFNRLPLADGPRRDHFAMSVGPHAVKPIHLRVYDSERP